MFVLVLPNKREVLLPDHSPVVLGRVSTTTGTLPAGCRVYRVDSSGKKTEEWTKQMGPRDIEIIERMLQQHENVDEDVQELMPVIWSVQR